MGAVLVETISNNRFTYRTETEFQDGIADLLALRGFRFEREVRLNDRDRIDFLVGRVGIEIKVKGSWTDAVRQLQRYAASDRIDELVLITTRLSHAKLISEIGGKPLTIKWVGAWGAF